MLTLSICRLVSNSGNDVKFCLTGCKVMICLQKPSPNDSTELLTATTEQEQTMDKSALQLDLASGDENPCSGVKSPVTPQTPAEVKAKLQYNHDGKYSTCIFSTHCNKFVKVTGPNIAKYDRLSLLRPIANKDRLLPWNLTVKTTHGTTKNVSNF